MKINIFIIILLVTTTLSNLVGIDTSQPKSTNLNEVQKTKEKLNDLLEKINKISPEKLDRIKNKLNKLDINNIYFENMLKYIEFLKIAFKDMIDKLDHIKNSNLVQVIFYNLKIFTELIIQFIEWIDQGDIALNFVSKIFLKQYSSFNYNDPYKIKEALDILDKSFKETDKNFNLINEYLRYIDKLKTKTILSMQKQGIFLPLEIRKEIYKRVKLPTYAEWILTQIWLKK